MAFIGADSRAREARSLEEHSGRGRLAARLSHTPVAAEAQRETGMTDGPTPTATVPEPTVSIAETRKRLRPVDWVKMVGLGIVFFIAFALVGSLFLLPNTVTSLVGLFLATWLAGRIVGWHGTARWILAALLIFVVTAIVSTGLLLLFSSDVQRVLRT